MFYYIRFAETEKPMANRDTKMPILYFRFSICNVN